MRPLRALFIDEGVLGHRTLAAQLHAATDGDPSLEPTFESVPPPSRIGRLLLRRLPPLGDADMFGLRWRLRWSWQVRRAVKRHAGSVDVVFLNTQASALLIRGMMRRLPVVLCVDATVRQFTALDYGGKQDRWSPVQERLIALLERRAVGGAATVVALTEWNARALREEYDLSAVRLATLHPGVDAEWWGKAAKRGARRGGPLRVLFVGNDVERKGLGSLIAAIERLGGDAVLDVVTGHAATETEAVRVHSGVEAGSERLRRLYSSADVFALPTRADAVPWVVLEAMASGLPVIASRVGAIEELVDDTGVLVGPNDADGLVAALRRLRDPQLRERLGAEARRRVLERYDSAIQTPRLLRLLREVAGDPFQAAGTRRMRRRTFVAVGLGAAGVALAAPYAVLLADDEFERLVASRLGVETHLAGDLLERARAAYGDAEYEARAAAFAFAVRDPAATLLPDGLREKAISGLLEPMLSAPAAKLAYGVTGSDPGSPACAGLVRPR